MAEQQDAGAGQPPEAPKAVELVPGAAAQSTPPQAPAGAKEPPPAAPPELGAVEDGDVPPPLEAQVSDDDLDFAARAVERLSNVDFRSPPPARPAVVDAAEKKNFELRERIRELERNQARLAFVYGARRKRFDTAISTIESLKQSRRAVEAQLRQVKQDESAARQEQERTFSGMLTQAQQAFTELREQSSHAISQYDQQLQTKSQELESANARLLQLQQDLDAVRSQQQQTVNAYAEKENQRAAERAQTLAERTELAERASSLAADLRVHRQEVERLREVERETSNALRTAREELRTTAAQFKARHQQDQESFAQAENSWLDKAAKLKESASVFRDAYQERDQDLQSKNSDIATLQASLEARRQELERLEKIQKDLSKALKKGPADVVELRLEAFEDMLKKQEALLKRLISRSDERTRTSSFSLSEWLLQKPIRMVIAIAVPVALVFVVAVLALVSGGSSEPEPAKAATVLQEAPPPRVDKTRAQRRADAKAARAEAKVQSETEAVSAEQPADKGDQQDDGGETADAAAVAEFSGRTAQVKGSEEDRKALRKEMLKAASQKKWGQAVEQGLALRHDFRLDWETHFKLAEALRRMKRLDEARGSYASFVETYPTNAFADDARYWVGSMLVKLGKTPEALRWYEQVARDQESNYRAKAKVMLKKLK